MILNMVVILSSLGFQLITTKAVTLAQNKRSQASSASQDQNEILEAVQNHLVIDEKHVEYQPDIGQHSVTYVEKEPSCHMEEKVVFEDICEP